MFVGRAAAELMLGFVSEIAKIVTITTTRP
jgi:hypothetical protein